MFPQSAQHPADAEQGDHDRLAEGGHRLASLPGSGAPAPTQDDMGAAADALVPPHGEPGQGGEHGVHGPGVGADADLHGGLHRHPGAAPRPARQVQSQRDKNILQRDAESVEG